MLDVMTSEYIEVARAKGLCPWRILVKHALRNALIPVTTILAVNIGWLLSGAVVVEYLFSFPGLGSLLVRAVGYVIILSSRDCRWCSLCWSRGQPAC